MALSLLLAGLASAQPSAPPSAPPRKRDLTEVFGPDGSIAIPYEDLLRLIRGEDTTDPTPDPTPERAAAFVLVGASLKGTAREHVLELEGTVDVELVGGEGWVVVPIRMQQAVLQGATIDGKPATVGLRNDLLGLKSASEDARRAGGYGVLVRGKGRKTLAIQGEVPLSRGAGSSSFRLDLPAAALSKLLLDVPAADAALQGELNRQPAERSGERATVTAFYGAHQTASASWSVRAKTTQASSSDRKPLVSAEVQSAVRLEEGVLLTRVHVTFRVLQAPAETLWIRIPTGATLLEASGERLARFEKRDATSKGVPVALVLSEPVLGEASFVLDLEQTLPEEADLVPISRIETLGTQRQQGVVAIRAARYLTLEPRDVQALAKVQPKELSSELHAFLGWQADAPRPPLTFSHRGGAWGLKVATRPVQAEVEGKLYSLAVVRDDEVALATTAQVTVHKRPVFELRFALPDGYSFLHFGNPGLVRDHRIEEGADKGRVLVVALREPIKAEGVLALGLFGLVPRDADTEALSVSRLRLLGAAKESGTLVVGARHHLQLTPTERAQGLWPLDLGEVADGFPHGPSEAEELLYAYRHAQAEARATFKAAKREPRLRVALGTLVDAQEDQVRVTTRAKCTVEFAGLTSIRLKGPKVLAERLEFEQEGIAGTEVAIEGDAAIWTISLQGKRSGAFQLGWHYAIKLDDFSAGQQKEVSLAPLEVQDCFLHSEEIALKKHENLVAVDVRKDLVESRDPQTLEASLQQAEVVRAYRVQDWPFGLTFQLTKYDFRSSLGIEIRHLHVDEVLRERGTQAEAILELQNRNQQDLQILLPPGAKMQGLQVAGRRSEWRAGSPQEGRPLVIVHLGQVARQQASFQVRLRYDFPLGLPSLLGEVAPAGLGFPLAKPRAGDPREVPIARSTRTLYLPHDYAYLSFEGGTKHFAEEGVWRSLLGFLRELSGQPYRPGPAAKAAVETQDAIARLRGQRTQVALYTPLELPSRRTHQLYLFERLGGSAAPAVRAMAWPLFYLLDLLVLAAIMALGVVIGRKELPGSPWAFPLGVFAVSLLGGAVGGRALQPFFAAAILAATALLVIFLCRVLWKEMTERRSERSAERTEREARVARERAAAMEAEAALRETQGDGAQGEGAQGEGALGESAEAAGEASSEDASGEDADASEGASS